MIVPTSSNFLFLIGDLSEVKEGADSSTCSLKMYFSRSPSLATP